MTYEEQLAHLVSLARHPGFKEYAWHRAKELDACKSQLWQGIAAALVKQMKKPPQIVKPPI